MSNRNPDGDGLRVMTFNLLSPDHADWSRRREIIRMDLRRLRPDLVSLQECVWGDGEDQVADLLGKGYEQVRHPGRSADGVGAVLASRWPFGTMRELDLHVPPRHLAMGGGRGRGSPAARAVRPHAGSAPQAHLRGRLQLRTQTLSRGHRPVVEEQLAGRQLHVIVLRDFDDTPRFGSISKKPSTMPVPATR
jgi:endonuclease/exonuclease/phosphatase family metal-dependent hydrolase